ncbi:hypothetical protein HPP92_022731 [Vanilla planifolia]|uniref:RNA polymerase sigma-70 region 3 domain-containing protein n=1 Tax=Vanilla planifolia TaxID=51239 RepID=A0A835PTW9_VANPL|nr:hypothetical protein HPP92_022731 [Vanilla planifolia]
MHPQPNSSSLETAKPEKKRNVKEEIKQLKLLCSAGPLEDRNRTSLAGYLLQRMAFVRLISSYRLHRKRKPNNEEAEQKQAVGSRQPSALLFALYLHLPCEKKLDDGECCSCWAKNREGLKERLGFEPSDKQLASSMKMSRDDLHSKLAESFSARQKLVMSNVRLVMSIAQKFDNMGSEMADLVQGVSRTLAENSRTVRVPTHLQERLGSIRRAKYRLLEKGLTPSINNIAGFLNMSTQKVRNATEAFKIVLSFDKEAFPSLNGLPGETLHSYVTDSRLDYNPWHGFEDWSLKTWFVEGESEASGACCNGEAKE